MLYINGVWTKAQNGKTQKVINPATEQAFEETAYGNDLDATLCVEAAQVAFEKWRQTTPYERASILKKTAEHIRIHTKKYAVDTVAESGKPLIEAEGEWAVAANLFEWYAEEAKRAYGRTIPSMKKDKRMSVLYQPMGVVGAITAWNFPVYNPARCWAAALAAGCCVCAKPSEYTPLSAMNLTKSLIEAGIPKGVFHLLIGDADSIGKVFLQHVGVQKISFTGSTRVGKILLEGAAETNTKLSLELGGNAPVIVMNDVDVASVAKGLLAAKLRNSGQICICPQRVYVQRDIYYAFIEELRKNLETVRIGNGMDKESTMGPLINLKQKKGVEELQSESLKEKGAKIHTLSPYPSVGYFMPPAILYDISHQNILCQKEVFGPLLPVIAFDTKEQALQYANDTSYGLAAYIWTNNLRDAYFLSEQVQSGLVGINEWSVQAVEGPFGGWKESGLGAECGTEGLLEYMERKLISTGGI